MRERRGISQEQLALEGDFDRSYISLIERGIQSPTVRTLVKLAGVLSVAPSVLIRRMERVLAAQEDVTDAKRKQPSKRPPPGAVSLR